MLQEKKNQMKKPKRNPTGNVTNPETFLCPVSCGQHISRALFLQKDLTIRDWRVSAFNALTRVLSSMEDRLSTLPDDILGLILSRIPVREATRCSILSKRWRYAYIHISDFKFSPFLIMGPPGNLIGLYPRQWVEDTISNILRLHSSYVEGFHLSIDGRRFRFTPEKVSRWVQYAASKNVKSISLCQCPQIEIPPPATLFTCACLTTLKLSNYILTSIPNTFLGFNHLISCSFRNVLFTDDSLALFISRCPLLQRLTINRCDGLLNPVISAPNITCLVIHVNFMEVLTIECPRLLTLKKAETRAILRVNGVCFDDHSPAVLSLKMERSSSLVELWLVWQWFKEEPIFTADRLPDIVSNFKSLKKFSITILEDLEKENEEMTVPLFKLFQSLPNLEFLYMGGKFASELGRDRIPERLSSPLANLRILQVDTVKLDDSELAVLGCLLQSTPALEIMEFRPRETYKEFETPDYIRFSEKLYSLKRASTEVRIYKGILDDRILDY